MHLSQKRATRQLFESILVGGLDKAGLRLVMIRDEDASGRQNRAYMDLLVAARSKLFVHMVATLPL